MRKFYFKISTSKFSKKGDITNFIKKTDFDDKLKNLNKNVTSVKTKRVLVENELNELLKKIKVISTKGLTKGLVNKFSIINGAKYFSA